MSRKSFFLVAAVAFMFTGCGSEPQTKKEPEAKAPLSKADQMRQKAKIAEAASLVGYDGKAIKQNLNKIIDESENANKQLQELNDLR